MLLGVNPLWAFALAGLGAAAYAPAKYGLVTELAKPEQLITANAWIEISTVSAVLLGVVLGGALVSPAWVGLAWVQTFSAQLGMSSVYSASFVLLLLCYGLASFLNLFIQGSGKVYSAQPWRFTSVCKAFGHDMRRLWLSLIHISEPTRPY